jgi:hypothetical protein
VVLIVVRVIALQFAGGVLWPFEPALLGISGLVGSIRPDFLDSSDLNRKLDIEDMH